MGSDSDLLDRRRSQAWADAPLICYSSAAVIMMMTAALVGMKSGFHVQAVQTWQCPQQPRLRKAIDSASVGRPSLHYVFAGLCASWGSVRICSERCEGRRRRCPRQHELCRRFSGKAAETIVSRPLVALFILGGKRVHSECVAPLFRAVQAHGKIVHATIYVEDWRAELYDIAEIKSLGIKVHVAPPVKGGTRTCLSQDLHAATDVDAVAIFPSADNQAQNFTLARSRGQQTWAVRAKNDPCCITDALHSIWLDDMIEFVRPSSLESRELLGKSLVLQRDGKKSKVKAWGRLALKYTQDLIGLTQAMKEVIEAFVDLQYLKEKPSIQAWSIQAACAKFGYMNGLDAVPIVPISDGIAYIHEQLRLRCSQHWTSNPGDLALFMPSRRGGLNRASMRGASRALAGSVAGGGPFIARTTNDLVPYVFQRMGFIHQNESVCRQTIDLFSEIGSNFQVLSAAGVTSSKGISEADLHRAFSNQDVNQAYVCAPSDVDVRRYLVSRGRITDGDSQDDVKEAMREFLSEAYPDRNLPTIYAGLVRSMLKHMNPNDPSQRKVKHQVLAEKPSSQTTWRFIAPWASSVPRSRLERMPYRGRERERERETEAEAETETET